MAAAPTYPGTIKTLLVAFTTADTTATFKDVWAPTTGSSGGILHSLAASQDSSVGSSAGGRWFTWAISTGGAAYIIGETAVTSGAGTDGATPSMDVLNASSFPFVRSDGVNRYMQLAPGYKLQARPRVVIDAGKTCYFAGQSGEY